MAPPHHPPGFGRYSPLIAELKKAKKLPESSLLGMSSSSRVAAQALFRRMLEEESLWVNAEHWLEAIKHEQAEQKRPAMSPSTIASISQNAGDLFVGRGRLHPYKGSIVRVRNQRLGRLHPIRRHCVRFSDDFLGKLAIIHGIPLQPQSRDTTQQYVGPVRQTLSGRLMLD